MRSLWVAYALMLCVVVGFNLPIEASPEVECKDYVEHQLVQEHIRLIPRPDISYALCVQRMRK